MRSSATLEDLDSLSIRTYANHSRRHGFGFVEESESGLAYQGHANTKAGSGSNRLSRCVARQAHVFPGATHTFAPATSVALSHSARPVQAASSMDGATGKRTVLPLRCARGAVLDKSLHRRPDILLPQSASASGSEFALFCVTSPSTMATESDCHPTLNE